VNPILRILSGGQTGVDRGALDAAIVSQVEYGGWCPKGGWAEDAPMPPGVVAKYPRLRETPSGDPRQRTAWNVRDGDAVLALFDRRGMAISPGTRLAVALATECGKPCLCLDLDAPASLDRALAWLRMEAPLRALNIAGPRESEAPGIYGLSRRFIVDLLARNV
jgi:hypothetical protein